MTPSTATMAWRKAIGMAMGAPSVAAAVVAIMAPIIQASGRRSWKASQPPAIPTASASTVVRGVAASSVGWAATGTASGVGAPALKRSRPGPGAGP